MNKPPSIEVIDEVIRTFGILKDIPRDSALNYRSNCKKCCFFNKSAYGPWGDQGGPGECGIIEHSDIFINMYCFEVMYSSKSPIDFNTIVSAIKIYEVHT